MLALDAFHYACVVQDFESENFWYLRTDNPMYKSFMEMKHHEYFSFAIQFIKIIDVCHKMLKNNIFIEALNKRQFKDRPKIQIFYDIIKKVFIYYCKIWPHINSHHLSDAELNKIIVEKICHRIKFDTFI